MCLFSAIYMVHPLIFTGVYKVFCLPKANYIGNFLDLAHNTVDKLMRFMYTHILTIKFYTSLSMLIYGNTL